MQITRDIYDCLLENGSLDTPPTPLPDPVRPMGGFVVSLRYPRATWEVPGRYTDIILRADHREFLFVDGEVCDGFTLCILHPKVVRDRNVRVTVFVVRHHRV